MITTNEIRRSFIDYFVREEHVEASSTPLVPYNDPTLMFVNAGMVPFKNVFTGLESPSSPRAVSSQKCVRAGGKHNDLDNVGYTSRHHTFFEMLGNFSFGDYFKEEAIHNAWTLLTTEWGLDPARLTTTVFHEDEEAFGLWKKISGLPEERIIKITTSDNFWSMGDSGPCGPCSEIFFDHGEHIDGGPPGSAEEDGDRFVEIWNLVFMQFDQLPDGKRVALPKPSIDTGMGLERIAAVMQQTHDNYNTDTFKALITASEDLSGVRAGGDHSASHRVIADHLRSISFLMADGVLPSNEGRGYVLRRIMRRAMRHAHLLGVNKPLMHKLVPALVTEMGQAYPELVRGQVLIEEVLEREETQFRRTLEKGLRLLDEATFNLKESGELDGKTAFKLYDTYGFPYDLTEDALRSRGLRVDKVGFDRAMEEQKKAARAAWKGSGEASDGEVWFDIVEREGATEFTGYSSNSGEGRVVALVKEGAEVGVASSGEELVLLTNQTPFYGESGGQTGDSGVLSTAEGLLIKILETTKPLGRLHAHHGKIVAGSIRIGDTVHMKVDEERRNRIRANHSATHLVHSALRNILGSHVTQKGSLVGPDKFRFDFSHLKPLTSKQIFLVEAEVNAEILANQPVSTRQMSPQDAVAAGALALFGEKYGDEVRVLSMGRLKGSGTAYSVELCGGTHVNATGDIGLFRIVSESAVASGIRRIEALTGNAARDWLVSREDTLKGIATKIRSTPEGVAQRIEVLLQERKALEKELAETKKELALTLSVAEQSGPAQALFEDIAGVKFSAQVLDGLNAKELRPLLDKTKKEIGSGIAAVVAVNDGKAAFAVAVTQDLVERFSAIDLVRVGVEVLGGKGGGGRPDMAQGGGPDGSQANKAIDAVKAMIAHDN
jgi:alanyl-tRNA synthetase